MAHYDSRRSWAKKPAPKTGRIHDLGRNRRPGRIIPARDLLRGSWKSALANRTGLYSWLECAWVQEARKERERCCAEPGHCPVKGGCRGSMHCTAAAPSRRARKTISRLSRCSGRRCIMQPRAGQITWELLDAITKLCHWEVFSRLLRQPRGSSDDLLYIGS